LQNFKRTASGKLNKNAQENVDDLSKKRVYLKRPKSSLMSEFGGEDLLVKYPRI
jgi:hypothetical protein